MPNARHVRFSVTALGRVGRGEIRGQVFAIGVPLPAVDP
jgi:hypothetical protein